MSHLHGGVVGVNQDDPGCPLHAVHVSAPSPHDGLTQPAMADHPHPCQYQDKITTASPTTARVLLMFLRDFVELRTTYASWTQSCPCPMEKCPQTFSEPLQLIEHLLLCSEMPRGEFKCWKCSNAHGVPTNCEKEWTGVGVQRKRSVSQKVKEAFARRGSLSKVAPNMAQKSGGTIPQDWPQLSDTQFRQLDPNGQLDVRLNQGLCQPPNTCGLNCVFTGLQTAVREGDMDMADFPDCPTPTTDCSKHDQAWAEVDSIMCGISSHTPSTIYDSGQASDSSNTSPQESLLYLNHYPHQLVQPDGSILGSPPYLNGTSFHTQSPLPQSAVEDMYLSSPVDPGADCEPQPWWGMTHVPPGVNPGFSPPIVCQPPADMGSPAVHMPPVTAPEMSISGSHTSSYEMDHSHNSPYGQHRGIPYQASPNPDHRLYQPEIQAFSPQPDHQMDQKPDEDIDDGSEELVCDLCNWKPRGVRDNLKGYLRKHKNTHKNLRFPCTVEGCNKDFGRLDNLKAHMRDKHPTDAIPAKTEPIEEIPVIVNEDALGPEEAGQKRRRDSSEQFRGIRGPLPQHSVLWSFNMG